MFMLLSSFNPHGYIYDLGSEERRSGIFYGDKQGVECPGNFIL